MLSSQSVIVSCFGQQRSTQDYAFSGSLHQQSSFTAIPSRCNVHSMSCTNLSAESDEWLDGWTIARSSVGRRTAVGIAAARTPAMTRSTALRFVADCSAWLSQTYSEIGFIYNPIRWSRWKVFSKIFLFFFSSVTKRKWFVKRVLGSRKTQNKRIRKTRRCYAIIRFENIKKPHKNLGC